MRRVASQNPPRPLASWRVELWLFASVPPQPLPVPPIYSHQGEGNPPLPLPAGPDPERCWRLGAPLSLPGTLPGHTIDEKNHCKICPNLVFSQKIENPLIFNHFFFFFDEIPESRTYAQPWT